MKAALLHIISAAVLLAVSVNATAVAPAAPKAEEALTTSISSVGNTASAASLPVLPLELTAVDLVTKVYGVFDTNLSEAETVEKAGSCYNLTPSADSTGLWLEPADGYVVSYYGMTPEIRAVAHYDENGASDYSYFVLFPYEAGRRGAADYEQCAFCGTLLQEMNDLGLIIGVPDAADSIFEAFGSMTGNHVTVRLIEQENPDDSGLFVLMLDVIPKAFTASDDILALE